MATPSKKESFAEAAERMRRFLTVLSDEEKELLTNHLRGYLKILMKKEGLEIDDAFEQCLDREEADVMLTYMQKEIRKAMIEAAGDDGKISELQEQYRAMTTLQKKISAGLGGRLII